MEFISPYSMQVSVQTLCPFIEAYGTFSACQKFQIQTLDRPELWNWIDPGAPSNSFHRELV